MVTGNPDHAEPPPAPPRYLAFISHSHADRCPWWHYWNKWPWWYFWRRPLWGEVLHRQLEGYRIPKKLRGRNTAVGAVPDRLFPVFLDNEELPASSDLSHAIQTALRESRTLVVISSPNAERSRWVNQEVRAFKSFAGDGRPRVLSLIVGGEPNADDKAHLHQPECFPEPLRYEVDADGRVLRDRRVEPIAADVRPGESPLHDATLKIVAGIIGVRYAELKQRDQARRRWTLLRNVMVLAAVFGAAGWIAVSERSKAQQEVSALHEWRIKEQNLPFARMAGKYSEKEQAELRERRDAAAEMVKIQDAREEVGIALPAETEGLAHDLALTEAELAWSMGDLAQAEAALQRAVKHVERQAEITKLRYEMGVDRTEAVLHANGRRTQTRMALTRLKQVVQDLQAAGLWQPPE